MEEKSCCEITCMDVTPLAEEGLFRAWLERMPESRREKVLSMRFAEGRRLRLGVGILLFRALESRGLDGSRTEIAEGELGKPWIPEHPEIHFSLSHAGTWAMCAVSGQPVGCDAEQTGRGNEKVAFFCFTPGEAEMLRGIAGPAERDLAFTRIWTRKESYLKALGKGLSLSMKTFSVLEPPPGAWFAERGMAEGYVFTCCGLGAEPEEIRWTAAAP